jgi:hypothetical protein
MDLAQAADLLPVHRRGTALTMAMPVPAEADYEFRRTRRLRRRAERLPAIYVAANACSNTMLVKARAQFSMPNVMRALLVAYDAIAAMQFFVTGFAAEVMRRFISGVVAGGMTPWASST